MEKKLDFTPPFFIRRVKRPPRWFSHLFFGSLKYLHPSAIHSAEGICACLWPSPAKPQYVERDPSVICSAFISPTRLGMLYVPRPIHDKAIKDIELVEVSVLGLASFPRQTFAVYTLPFFLVVASGQLLQL